MDEALEKDVLTETEETSDEETSDEETTGEEEMSEVLECDAAKLEELTLEEPGALSVLLPPPQATKKLPIIKPATILPNPKRCDIFYSCSYKRHQITYAIKLY